MPKEVMNPQTKKVTMWPPSTCDHASQPQLGGSSIEDIRVRFKVVIASCLAGVVSRSWDSADSVET